MKTIKCPICGSEEFIPFDRPIEDDCANIRGNTYICPRCGYVLWLREDFPKSYQATLTRIQEIDEETKKLELLLKDAENSKNDVTCYKKELEEREKELNQRIKWGDDERVICSVKERIEEIEKIISSGVNIGVVNDINNYRHDIEKLQSEKDSLLKSIRTIKLPA